MHIRDAAVAFLICLQKDSDIVNGQTFNIGANELNYQIVGLAQLVTKFVGKEVRIEEIPEDADARSYRVDFSKAKRVLGFTVKDYVQDGILEIAKAIRSGLLGDTESISYYNIKSLKEHYNLVAIEGGEPSRVDFLPFALPLIGKKRKMR